MPPGVAATSFIGRRRELAALSRLLKSCQLLTITGPGGAGKTRLAAAAVARLRRVALAWVDLAPLRESADVFAATERAIGLSGDGAFSDALILEGLRGRSLAVVLDNCEHLMDASRTVVTRLLASSDALIVATSRVPLRVPGEVTFRVPPMSLPDAIDASPRSDRADAVRLFAERAVVVDPSFDLDTSRARIVGEICRGLEGHPLAIELAVARLRHVPLAELQRRVGQIATLDSGDDGAGRQGTMRATIGWSYDLLTEPARLALRLMSVLPGGFTLDAAESMCGPDAPDALAIISTLVDASLVDRSPDGRYRMLEPTRQFAEEQLRQHGEEEEAIRRAASHLVDLATARFAAEHGIPGADLRVRHEFLNVIGVMPWLMRTDPSAALSTLMRYSDSFRTAVPAHLSVLRSWLERALGAYAALDGLRALALVSCARLTWAIDKTDRGAQLVRQLTDEAIAIATTVDDPAALERARFMVATLEFLREPRDRALQAYDEVLPKLRDTRLIGMVHTGRAVVRQHLGDAAGAAADVRDAFAAWDRYGDPHVTDRTLTMLSTAEIAFVSGDLLGAADELRRSIAMRRSAGEAQEPTHFEFLAHIAAASGDGERALRLLGIADRLLEGHGSGPIPWWRLADRSWLQPVERALGPRADVLRIDGRRFPLEAAVAFALGERVVAVGLTEREHLVATLIADGFTDKEIATRLRISDRTAENHVQHIREKLGVRSRSQIARWIGQQLAAPAG